MFHKVQEQLVDCDGFICQQQWQQWRSSNSLGWISLVTDVQDAAETLRLEYVYSTADWVAPAGIAGEAINLGFTDPTGSVILCWWRLPAAGCSDGTAWPTALGSCKPVAWSSSPSARP